jgi:nucleoid-associated protein YgaU
MKRNYRGRLIGILIVLVLVAAGAGVWFVHGPNEVRAPQPSSSPSPSPPPQTQAQAPGPVLPSFDAFHVGDDGNAVIAGRAAPGAKVTVLEHGTPIGNATADKNGEWVIMTDRPLTPGAQQLSLQAQLPGTAAPQKSATTLAVIVPESETQPPVAVALPQGPGAAQPLALSSRAPRRVALDMVEYDASGRTILNGRADPGATVDVFVAGRKLGTAKPGADGSWSLGLDSGVPVGIYHLRLVSRFADGSQEETALDMRRASPGELGGGDYLAVVPGNNLWHLARRSYGDGLRYVEIYRANQGEIADPNLIYPNQLLSLPGKS